MPASIPILRLSPSRWRCWRCWWRPRLCWVTATHTEEIILQNKVTDQWSYYQAKNIRRHTDELFADSHNGDHDQG